MNRKETWTQYFETGIITTDEKVLRMLHETAAAEKLCRSIPGFDLAANALMLQLHALIQIASNRKIMGYYYPDGDELLDQIKIPKSLKEE